MANIKLTQLSELTVPNNQNTIFYVANLGVSPNVSHYIRLGNFTSDENIARLAFAQANDSLIVAEYSLNAGWNANIAFHRANAVYAYANTGYTQANNAASFSNGAFARANSGYAFANTGYTQANNAASFANGAFVTANSGASFANGAFVTANSGASFANGAFNQANIAFQQANNSFNVANVVFVVANSASSFANGAFTKANTAVQKTGDAISGVVTAPTAAAGTSNTMIATTQFVNNTIGVGVGQTWQRPARSSAIAYTNNTGKPIQVVIGFSQSLSGSGSATVVVGGVTISSTSYNTTAGGSSMPYTFSFVVPNNTTYSISVTGSTSLGTWAELR
jgi:hypothetical protein